MVIKNVDGKGRVVIPAEMRRKYGLHPGKKVKYETIKDGIRIIPLVTTEEIKANVGFLGVKRKRLKSLLEEKRI